MISIEEQLIKTFNLKDFLTLSNDLDKNRINLGEDYEGLERMEKAFKKASFYLDRYLRDKEVWLRMIFWNITNEDYLRNPIIDSIKKNLKSKNIVDENYVLYFLFKDFSSDKVAKILKSTIGYELGYEESINTTCFYFNLKDKVLINIYDDRGMDIVIKD